MRVLIHGLTEKDMPAIRARVANFGLPGDRIQIILPKFPRSHNETTKILPPRSFNVAIRFLVKKTADEFVASIADDYECSLEAG